VGTARRERPVEGDQRTVACPREGKQPSIGPQLRRGHLPIAYSRKRASTSAGSGTSATRSSSNSRSWTRQASVMDNGLPSMAAAVVISRRKPICVIRENAIQPVSCSHQRWAATACTCSDEAKASQTFTSGKLNELIDLFVSEVDAPAGRRNQGRIKAQPSPRARRFSLLDSPLDAGEDKLAGGAALASRRFMEPPMEIPR
jgi:hypothetical protein